MSWPLVQIGKYSDKVRTWNPAAGAEGVFQYVDLSSVDKSRKIIDLDNVAEISSAEAPSRARQLVVTGDVLVATVRPNLNGVAVVPAELNGATASTGYCVLRADEENLHGRYLFHWVQTGYFVEDMISKATGANYPAVSEKIIKESKIPLPPLPEQKRIAAILDKADAIRRKRQKAIQLADDFLRAVFLNMFGDPVSNPRGWEVKRLGDVVDSQLGKMLSQKSKSGTSSFKYLRNANVRWRGFEFDDLLEMDFSIKERQKFKLEAGDLLVCEGGDVGRCAIWRGNVADCFYQKALHRVRPNYKVLTSEYLQEYFFWMSRKGGLSSSVSEVTFSHLTAERLKDLKIPIPPIDTQRKFVNIYNSIIHLEVKSQSLEKGVTSTFSALSQKAFRGEL